MNISNMNYAIVFAPMPNAIVFLYGFDANSGKPYQIYGIDHL